MTTGEAKPKITVDGVTIFVALISSIATAILTGFNAYYYYSDRDDRLSQSVFDAQSTIAKSYFESFSKLPKGEFCDHYDDALLFARTARILAKMPEEQMATQLTAKSTNSAAKRSGYEGVQAVAYLISSDIIQRSKAQCDDKAVVVKSAAPGKIIDATQGTTSSASTYSIRNSSSAQSVAIKPTVWIHYAEGSSDATHAREIHDLLVSKGYAVPAIDPVQNVPSHNQVRVFRRQDAATATRIAKLIGIPDAQIVNLETAYRNLPGNTFEIWLKQPAPEGRSLDFSNPENSMYL